MTKFIELHSYGYDSPILVNVDSIAYVEVDYSGTMVYLRCSTIKSHDKSGTIDKIEGLIKNIRVIESYAKVKSLIEE